MKYEQEIKISAKPETVFSVYSAVSEWPKWDPEVEAASIDGEFVSGTYGKIKPKGTPESKMQLIEVTKDRSFTVECKLPLCRMQFIHLMQPVESGTRVVNQVVFSGLLSPLFGRVIGKGINKVLPDGLRALKNYIMKQS